jgi:hypothetical protein
MLTTVLLLVSLTQDSEPRLLFTWWIQGLEDPKRLTLVTVTPTPLGLVSGLDVKTIIIKPVPTRNDPNPRSIRPVKTEPTPKWGLQAWFKSVGRRFQLIVTFRDGATHKIDPWAPPPSGPPKIYQRYPHLRTAPQGKWARNWSGDRMTSRDRA